MWRSVVAQLSAAGVMKTHTKESTLEKLMDLMDSESLMDLNYDLNQAINAL